mmetsp:Transcript_9204/g.12481  ORF Transcript_9204/g.12481 Transcript_9204/m.12481 type:complete len:84 (+) Transcript_9204:282-533(+)
MIICLGPVCVPLWGVLPFLVGMLHRAGWFQWFKQEWVTFRWWKKLTYSTLGIEEKKAVKQMEDAGEESQGQEEGSPLDTDKTK